MSTFEIKASPRKIRLWLTSIINDKEMPAEDRWLAAQTLEFINKK
jgi:hypothetical protein